MRESNYFSHFYNARNDDKILKIRSKFDNAWGYGLFFMICETMAESTTGYIDYISMAELSLSFGIPTDKIKEFVDYCLEIGLFYLTDNKLRSKTMDEFKEFRRERSESGKKGAASKWLNHSSANGSANGLAIKEPMALKEKKGKDIYVDQSSDWYKFLSKDFPSLDIDDEFRKAMIWVKDNPRSDHKRFFKNWLLNSKPNHKPKVLELA